MTPFYRLLAAALLLTVAACSQVPDDPTAALSPQAFGTPQNDEVLDLTRYSGGVYAVGNTKGSLYAANQGNTDVFITKIGSDKRTVWSRQFGNTGDDGVSKVATDGGGNVYVFGSTTGSLARTNRGGTDFFLRKYSSAGNVVWTLQFGLETNDTPIDLVTTSNSVYVVGSSAGKGFFLYRYTFSGNTYWKRQLRTSLESPSISLDAAGDVYMTDTVDGQVIDVGFERRTYDIRLEKFSGGGALLWTRVYDFSEDDFAYQLVAHGGKVFLLANRYYVSDDDSAYVLYVFSDTGNLDRRQGLGLNDSYDQQLSNELRLFVDGSGIYTDTFTRYNQSTRPDMPDERVFRKYRSDGSLAWEKDLLSFGTMTAVAERGAGEVYVGGYTGSAYRPAAQSDALLVKLNAGTGATVWNK